jgi:hypothetical protein
MAEEANPTCPAWVDAFTEAVGHCVKSGVVPVAYDVWGPDDPEKPEARDNAWVVHFYPALSEMVGGPDDGAMVYPGLTVDVLSLLDPFDDIHDLSWSSQSRNRETRYDGAVLDVTGLYRGHPVWLRIFDEPPDDARIDALIEHHTGRIRARAQGGKGPANPS